MVPANKYNLSVYNKDVTVLQEAILILSCGNFCASGQLTSSCVDKEQQKLKELINLPQVPTHVLMVPSAISPHLLTDLVPDQPLNYLFKPTTQLVA